MCLAIPSKVIAIDTTLNSASVDTFGVVREASLDLMAEGEVEVGDFVLLHIGFVMNVIDEAQALVSIETYKALLDEGISET